MKCGRKTWMNRIICSWVKPCHQGTPMLSKYQCCQLPKTKTSQFPHIYKLKQATSNRGTEPPGKGCSKTGSYKQDSQFTILRWCGCTEHRAHSWGLDSMMLTFALLDELLPWGWLYLQRTTEFNSVCIINHGNSKIWSLQKFFEEKAVLHYFAACWKVRQQGY